MPRIIGIATAVPPYIFSQEKVRDAVRTLFDQSALKLDKLLPIFANTTIDKRHFTAPVEWYEKDHSFAERNRCYFQNALALSEQAIRRVLAKTQIDPLEIGHIFFVSTTGLSTPSIDAYLFNKLRLRGTVRRTPIWGLGCAGGIAGISRAYDWLKAYPDKIALVVAVELCSLTFIRNDLSASNFVATSLFADGCGAALLAGDRRDDRFSRTIEIQDVRAMTWENTLGVMGWEVSDAGLKVIFSKSIPAIVFESARPTVLDFLEANNLRLDDLDYLLSHPGGAKVVEAYRQALCLQDHQVQSMARTLKEYGNMSSATAFFVLENHLNSPNYRTGDRILSSALGPGFSTEMILGICR